LYLRACLVFNEHNNTGNPEWCPAIGFMPSVES
jgi:hypothetical protein